MNWAGYLWNYLRAHPDAAEWSERHSPAGGDDSFHYHAASVAEYLLAARQRVAAARADLDGSRDSWIIEGNSPFSLSPAVSPRSSRAILMTHGLTDSPFAMRDLAGFFQQRGFHVVAMQLPGHGTRPGDLLEVRWQDWARAHARLVELLRADFDAIYLCGFSAGATLSIYRSLLDPDIRGLFLFAPALGVAPLARMAAPLAWLGQRRRPLAWFDLQPDSDCFKYESLTQRAIAEVCRMIAAVGNLRRVSERRVPVFVAASDQDATLNPRATLSWFAAQPAARRMLFYTTGRPRVPEFVQCIEAHLPQQRIRSFSHTSLIQAPDNPHYGEQGSQRVCPHYYRQDPLKYARCKAGDEDCLGEMFDESEDCRVIRRLSWNPLFGAMLEEMHAFLDSLEDG